MGPLVTLEQPGYAALAHPQHAVVPHGKFRDQHLRAMGLEYSSATQTGHEYAKAAAPAARNIGAVQFVPRKILRKKKRF